MPGNVCRMALIASLAVLVVSCGKEGPDGPDGPSGPTTKSEAIIPFVSRLSDATLFSSASDADAVNTYVSSLSNPSIVYLDRVDNSGVARAQEIVLDNVKSWSAFAMTKVSGNNFQGGFTMYFGQPTRFVKTHNSGSAYVSGVAASLNGAIKQISEDGTVTSSRDVSFDVRYYTARFETEEQINAFGGASGLFEAIKAESRNFLALGTVKNDLFSKLEAAVDSQDSSYKVTEVAKGSGYTVFLLAGKRYWGLNEAVKKTVASGIDAYEVSIHW